MRLRCGGFVNELADGDAVLTYSPALRRYRVGRITGGAVHCPQWDDEKMSLVRPVEWLGEVCRDDLSAAAQLALGSVANFVCGIGSVRGRNF